MRLLLEIHARRGWWAERPQLAQSERTALGNDANEAIVSAGSAWELTTNQPPRQAPAVAGAERWARGPRRGRRVPTPARVRGRCVAHEQVLLGARDPIDRPLAAQSPSKGLALVMRNPVVADPSIPTRW